MKRGILYFFSSLLILAVVLLTFPVLAQNQQYHLKLLAVQESENATLIGSDADLYLEIQEGSGRVFLETFPLTKMDTQISTRFAKEAACHHFKLDCDRYDFIYTIKAKSSIIGGPSAGAAIAALTAIAVLDLPYDDKTTTVTGTINSGGIIGPVGGIKQKLEAASQAQLKKVLIPQGTAEDGFKLQEENRSYNNESVHLNESINLVRYGREKLNLEVLEVSSLDEVVFHLTGKQFNHENITVQEHKVYAQIMRGLQQVLCTRSITLQEEAHQENITFDTETQNFAQQKLGEAENASLTKDSYSAASFCFTANIRLRTDMYKAKNLSQEAYAQLFAVLEKKVTALEEKVAKEEISTIGDLQTLMIVEERLQDVREQLTAAQSAEIKELPSLLAYGEERLFSALSWIQFFAMDGKHFVLDAGHLEKSCTDKIAEAEERFQYLSLFLGEGNLPNIDKKIERTKQIRNQKKFSLCLITAAQAKADADAVLSSIGVREEVIQELLASKKKVVERIIAENSAEDSFPILGYSYYRYANALAEQEKYTALVYLEYALEMSDLSMYFPEEKKYRTVEQGIDTLLRNEKIIFFVIGVLAGVAITLIIVQWKKKKGKSQTVSPNRKYLF